MKKTAACALVLLCVFLQRTEAAEENGTALAFQDDAAAVTFCAQGRYAEAELLFRQLIAVQKKMLGEHPELADTLADFAWCRFQQRHQAEAEALLHCVLAMEETFQCKDYRRIATVLDSLAAVQAEQGRHAEAAQG